MTLYSVLYNLLCFLQASVSRMFYKLAVLSMMIYMMIYCDQNQDGESIDMRSNVLPDGPAYSAARRPRLTKQIPQTGTDTQMAR